METRNIQISLEQAKEVLTSKPELSNIIYNTFPELKPKPIIVDRWKDLKRIKGYFISTSAELLSADGLSSSGNKNVYATEKQAKSMLAYAQLTQLMQDTGDCDIDWHNNVKKHTIERQWEKITKTWQHNIFTFLTFNTQSVRDEFFEKHIELIKEFYQI